MGFLSLATKSPNNGYYPYGFDSTDIVRQYHPFTTLNASDREDIEIFHQAPNPKLKYLVTSGEQDDKSIAKDTSYAKANTCKNFISRLTGESKLIFNSLFNDKDFIRLIMSNQANSQYIIPQKLYAYITKITPEILFKLLDELNMRLHIEHGDYWMPIDLLKKKKNQYLITRPESTNLEDLELDYPLVSPDITAQDIENFKQITFGQANYRNTYAQSIQTVAMISHNRTSVTNNVCEFMNNMIRYGHTQREKPIQFLVIDDSNDEGKETRYQELRKKAALYKHHNIDLSLITQAEKERLIEFFVQKIDSKLPEEDRRELIHAALGNNGGPGAQRNWATLFGAIILDDDVHPYCYLNLNDELRAMPVDVLGITTRSLTYPYIHSVNFAYSGKSGVPFVSTVNRFFQAGHDEDYNSYDTYGTRFRDDQIELGLCQPNWDRDGISGGIQAIASTIYSNDIDLPFISTSQQYLRIEDNAPMFIGQALNSKLATKSGFRSPGGAIYHNIEKPKITESMIRQGILEPFSCSIIEAFLICMLTLPSDSNKDKATLLSDTGNFLLKTLDSTLKPILQSIAYLSHTGCDHNEAFDTWFALLKSNENSTSIQKREVCQMIRATFADFGLLEFYDKEYKVKDLPDWSKLKLSKLVNILSIELKHYAKAMKIWPSLVEVARTHREELLTMLNV